MADSIYNYNLPIEAHTRYAQDRQILDEALLKDSGNIPYRTRIEVTEPVFSEFDTLFELNKRRAPWGEFAPPPDVSKSRRVFAETTLPRLGSPDKQEVQLQKLKQMEIGGKESHLSEIKQREKQILISFFNQMKTSDISQVEINSKRNQYSKG